MEPVPLPPRDIHPKMDALPKGTEALAELHTRLEDTIAGYGKVVEKAEPDFRGIAVDFKALHTRHAGAVVDMLVQDGHNPAEDGSIFGAVNRGLVEVRSWFDDIGTNMMDALIQGEKHVLEGYDQAIAATDLPERRAALNAMRDGQIAMMDRHCSSV